MIGNRLTIFFCTWLVIVAAVAVEDTAPRLDPLAPPLGLKTYRDLGLTVDENMLARAWRGDGSEAARLQRTLVKGGWVFPLFDPGHQIKLTLSDPQTLWSSYSNDGGRTWSEPRFVAALTGEATLKSLEFRRAAGKTLRFTLENTPGKKCDVWFREDDLCRLATAADVRGAPPGRFVLTSVPPENHDPDLLADSICIARDIAFTPAQPPHGYKVPDGLGLLINESMTGQVIHRARSKAGTLYETRAVVTPRGDYLVMIPDGQHANTPRDDANSLLGYRSSDQGQTWSGPFSPFGDQSKHHGGLPLVPKGGERMYVFETQRGALAKPATGDKAVGFRTSDDDGHTWSPVQLVRLTDGKYFGGLGVIQMTETAAGTWMVGFHHGRVLRGGLKGTTREWSVTTPTKPADPLALENLYFLDELRVLGLSDASVLAMARTCEGHLWQMRSADDGLSWRDVRPTSLVQPDAPPMVFTLSDGKTLIALHHNRAVLRSVHEPVHSEWLNMPAPTAAEIALRNEHRTSVKDWVSRAEVWFSLSKDEGQTWSEPRFLFANALAETLDAANPNYQCSYIDLFVDHGVIHLIVPHRWNRIVHLSFPEDQLASFLTRDELRRSLP
ncbi:MAG TPA: sialidase family protein [Chthoniobacteraceae bacterium]|jgi:hypothetical protein|nr:sialidase family protein [Chthoniobacteraceae bacterium]